MIRRAGRRVKVGRATPRAAASSPRLPSCFLSYPERQERVRRLDGLGPVSQVAEATYGSSEQLCLGSGDPTCPARLGQSRFSPRVATRALDSTALSPPHEKSIGPDIRSNLE
jgi:hypothetical protein